MKLSRVVNCEETGKEEKRGLGLVEISQKGILAPSVMLYFISFFEEKYTHVISRWENILKLI